MATGRTCCFFPKVNRYMVCCKISYISFVALAFATVPVRPDFHDHALGKTLGPLCGSRGGCPYSLLSCAMGFNMPGISGRCTIS